MEGRWLPIIASGEISHPSVTFPMKKTPEKSPVHIQNFFSPPMVKNEIEASVVSTPVGTKVLVLFPLPTTKVLETKKKPKGEWLTLDRKNIQHAEP